MLQEDEFEILDAETDPDEQKSSLIRSLSVEQGFALYFVVCDPGDKRKILVRETIAELIGKRFQTIPVTVETNNLLHLLQTQIAKPLPDAVFVYGLESWISAAVDPRSIPFILNLNAARNAFYSLVDRPLVFFVARHVFRAIANGAPDFFSVRSGVFTFALSPSEQKERTLQTYNIGQEAILDCPVNERLSRIGEAEHLLEEIRLIDELERNRADECFLLNQIGVAYLSLGKFIEAQTFLSEALTTRRTVFGNKDDETITSIINLGGLYSHIDDYAGAERLFLEALSYVREAENVDNTALANCLTSLAGIYHHNQRNEEAEKLYTQALDIIRSDKTVGAADLAKVLNNFGNFYQHLGQIDKAEKLFLEAISIMQKYQRSDHVFSAYMRNNLALLYSRQGRFAEAEPLFIRSLNILRGIVGVNSQEYKKVERSYAVFLLRRANSKNNRMKIVIPKLPVAEIFKSKPSSKKKKR